MKSISPILDPLLEIFEGAFSFITESLAAFGEGVMPLINKLLPVIKNIFDGINDIVRLLFSSEDALMLWRDVFEFLGEVVGTVLVTSFKVLESIITGIKDSILTIQGIIDAIAGKELKKEQIKGMGDLLKGLITTFIPGAQQALLKEQNVQDVIITKRGEVIRTSPDDTIMAFKGLGGGSERSPAPVNISVDFRGMQLNIQNATREEAERFGEDIVTTFRKQLSLEMERIGVK